MIPGMVILKTTCHVNKNPYEELDISPYQQGFWQISEASTEAPPLYQQMEVAPTAPLKGPWDLLFTPCPCLEDHPS